MVGEFEEGGGGVGAEGGGQVGVEGFAGRQRRPRVRMGSLSYPAVAAA